MSPLGVVHNCNSPDNDMFCGVDDTSDKSSLGRSGIWERNEVESDDVEDNEET
jgi:hypothetical protein